MLGPRIGKYGKDGKPRAILGHNLTFAALGVFILWFCWFGFNGASTVGMDTDELIVSAGLVFFNTNLCTAVACCTTLIFTWLRYGKPDVSMTYNAALAGLVGITAGCDAVSPLGAAVMASSSVWSSCWPWSFSTRLPRLTTLWAPSRSMASAVPWALSSPASSPPACPRKRGSFTAVASTSLASSAWALLP